ncbi:unnamed protein product [Heterobilharzia americana]|nr:unnamed protein product [Heterobilharzia americana]
MDDFIINISGTNSTSVSDKKNSMNKSKCDLGEKTPTVIRSINTPRPVKMEKASLSVKSRNKLHDQGAQEKSQTSNSLQFGIDNKSLSAKGTVLDEMMNHPVKPKIEPVFSSKYWKNVCESLNIFPHLTSCLLDRFKLDHLTAIQEATLPPLVDGKDVLVRAQTGSGKTLAYAVPLFNRLISLDPPVERRMDLLD